MILGLGIDVVQVERLEKASPGLLERVFTPAERAYCETFGAGRHERYAGRFAVKEAVSKALGTGIAQGIRWTDIETLPDDLGAPRTTLSGAARDRLDSMGGRSLHVSISHDRTQAMAMAIVERNPASCAPAA